MNGNWRRLRSMTHGTGRTRRVLVFAVSALLAAPVVPIAVRPAVAAGTPAGTVGFAKIEGYWVEAGGPRSKAAIAAAITEAESSRLPGIIQGGQPYATTGWGLWQITAGNSEPRYCKDYHMLDPWNNAEAAVAKYLGDGKTFHPWTTFNDGAYRKFLPAHPPAPARVTDPGEYRPINRAPAGTHNLSQPGVKCGPAI
jgi:hypothetical protein